MNNSKQILAIASILDNRQLLDVFEVEDDDGAGARVSSNGLAGVRVLLYGLFLLLAGSSVLARMAMAIERWGAPNGGGGNGGYIIG